MGPENPKLLDYWTFASTTITLDQNTCASSRWEVSDAATRGLRPDCCGSIHGVALGQRTRVYRLDLPRSGSEQEASAEEIEVRAATHLAFQHLQAINVPRDRAGTLRHRHPHFDRRIVALETLC